MKAAVFRSPYQPLTIEQVDISNPKSREVLIRTAAVGVCHSDLHYIDGYYATLYRLFLGTKRRGSWKRLVLRWTMSSQVTTS